MAYIAHNLLTVIGDFYDSVPLEDWSFNLRFGGDLAPEDASDAQNTAIKTALETWFRDGTDNVGQRMTPHIRLTGFKWNAIGTDGKYKTPELPNTYWWTTPIAGTGSGAGSGVPTQPPQTSLVHTLRTAKQGGRYRGRVYLPCDSATLTTGYRVSSVYIDASIAALGLLIDDMNAIGDPAADGTGFCGVLSSFGLYNQVLQVTAGNTVDTQRRRRRSITESYRPAYDISV